MQAQKGHLRSTRRWHRRRVHRQTEETWSNQKRQGRWIQDFILKLGPSLVNMRSQFLATLITTPFPVCNTVQEPRQLVSRSLFISRPNRSHLRLFFCRPYYRRYFVFFSTCKVQQQAFHEMEDTRFESLRPLKPWICRETRGHLRIQMDSVLFCTFETPMHRRVARIELSSGRVQNAQRNWRTFEK